MIAFIDDHREAYGVEPICRALPIAPSTYHARAAGRSDPAKGSARSRRDAAPARSGGGSAGKASRWPAARWNA